MVKPVKEAWTKQWKTLCRQQCFTSRESPKSSGSPALRVNIPFIITIYICTWDAFTKADMWKNTGAIADFHWIFLGQPWVICSPLIDFLCILS